MSLPQQLNVKKNKLQRSSWPVKWWQVGLTIAALNVLNFLLEDRKKFSDYYESSDKPTFTPPNWVFPLAWGINNIAQGYAAWKLLRNPNIPHRNELLGLQAFTWLNYVAWQPTISHTQSPTLSKFLTKSYKIASSSSMVLASKSEDTKLITALTIPTIWTSFADKLASYMANENKDEFVENEIKPKIERVKERINLD